MKRGQLTPKKAKPPAVSIPITETMRRKFIASPAIQAEILNLMDSARNASTRANAILHTVTDHEDMVIAVRSLVQSQENLIGIIRLIMMGEVQ